MLETTLFRLGLICLVLISHMINLDIYQSLPPSFTTTLIHQSLHFHVAFLCIFINQHFLLINCQFLQSTRKSLWHSCQCGSYPPELNYSQRVQQSKVQSSRFPTTQQFSSPIIQSPIVQICNVRFTESDPISTARQLC